MSVRKLKPITPGQRFRVVNSFDAITTDKPERSLIAPIKNSGGRNSQGKMTMRYTGGGHKQRYRIIDFKRTKDGIPATVKSIEYDPNRTAFIALLAYADGEKTYVIAQNGLKVGQKLVSGADAQPEIETRSRSCYSSFCWNIRSIDGKRREICYNKNAFRRNKINLVDLFSNYWGSIKF
jgi:large subunit ribosomal protein L2